MKAFEFLLLVSSLFVVPAVGEKGKDKEDRPGKAPIYTVKPVFFFVRKEGVPKINPNEAHCLQDVVAASTEQVGWQQLEGARLANFGSEVDDRRLEDLGEFEETWEMFTHLSSSDNGNMTVVPHVTERRSRKLDWDDICSIPVDPGLEVFCECLPNCGRRRGRSLFEYRLVDLTHRSVEFLEVALTHLCTSLLQECIVQGAVVNLAFPTCGVVVFKDLIEDVDEEDAD